MIIAPPLRQLVLQAWAEYASHIQTGYVVHPAVPILYFGDRKAYENSALRVITAALNPSRTEFPDGDRFRRFRCAEGVSAELLDDHQLERYLGGLEAYYRGEPYRRWFAALEPILQGMGASFYPGGDSTALHTDICTPLATDPTWSRLSDAARASLSEPGRRIWHALVEYLQPDVILLSVAERHLASIRFARAQPPREIFRFERKRPYVPTATTLKLAGGKQPQLIFGRAATMPFGLISNDDKRKLGQIIRQDVGRRDCADPGSMSEETVENGTPSP